MITTLSENPLLLLFIVAAIGYGLGKIKIKGSSLGVAAVLFVGLFFGSLDKSLQIPNIILILGLAIFVYTVGLTSGPSFFATFRRRGFRDFYFVTGMMLFSSALTYSLFLLFDLEPSVITGIFAGSSTNTPALAGILDTFGSQTTDEDVLNQLIENSVVGYSISYPMGVLASMIAITLLQKWLKIDYKKEAFDLRKEYPIAQEIFNITVEITNPAVENKTLRDIMQQYNWTVVFGRIKHDENITLSNFDAILGIGDLIRVSGTEEELEQLITVLGEKVDSRFDDNETEYEIKRIFVSNPKVAGQTLAALNLNEKYSTIVTRLRRGDVDILVNNKTVFELGDRVRFVARKKDIPDLVRLFGDSYRALGQIDLLSFGFGMALGLLLGMITFELPGGIQFKLGFAGGPLIVALILGALRRTGPIVWTLPYSANLTLRQIGLIFLLATIGVRSGHTFVSTIMSGGAGLIFITGTIISLSTAFLTIFIGFKFLKIPFTLLTGMVANQPAILDFAIQKADNHLPNIGYALMMPVALIAKIVFVQILYYIM
ncbi:MAG: aspartate:alanine exchanger family transporter [Saprospiraceae bacterium]